MLTLLVVVKQGNVDRERSFLSFCTQRLLLLICLTLKFPACLIILQVWEHFTGPRSRTVGAPFHSPPWPVADPETAAFWFSPAPPQNRARFSQAGRNQQRDSGKYRKRKEKGAEKELNTSSFSKAEMIVGHSTILPPSVFQQLSHEDRT